MVVLCLMGFSTSGKTTLKNAIAAQHPRGVIFIETDDYACGTYSSLKDVHLHLATPGSESRRLSTSRLRSGSFCKTIKSAMDPQ